MVQRKHMRSDSATAVSYLRANLPATVSALALVLAVTAPVRAQEAALAQSKKTSDDTGKRNTVLEEVIVTGLRQSVESAQVIKMNAEQLVDSISAQDIGALPDRSVSEALQRIPGITLQRTNENRDPARLASEGGGVFIRGLSWVRSETNGRDIFSANNGRALSFEDVSSDLLAGVDVYKNASAELIEGGIGGTVNLRTRLPFDSQKMLIAGSLDYNYADLKKEGFTSGNLLISDQWHTGIGRIGALASVSIGNIGNRTDSIQAGRFDPADHCLDSPRPAAGQPCVNVQHVFIPNSLGWRRIDWEQKRTAVAVAVQWEPIDALTVTLQGLYAQTDPKDIEHAFGDTNGGYDANEPTNQFDGQGVLVAGTLQNFQPTADSRYGESHKKTTDYSLNVKYEVNDSWAVSGDFQYVGSKADVLSFTAFTQTGAPGTLSFDFRGDTPVMQSNQPGQVTQSTYWWAAAMDHIEDNDAQSRAGRLDAEFTFDDNPWLKSFRFGARATNKDATTRQTGWNWNLLSQQFWGPNDRSDPVQNANVAYLNNYAQGSSELFTYNNFFRGSVTLPGTGWFPTAALVGNGTQNAYGILRSTETSGWGWVPLTADDFVRAHPAGDNVSGGINLQNEQTKAFYAVLRFAHAAEFMSPLDGNIGVRVVKTETDASGQGTVVTAPQAGNNCVVGPGVPSCAFYNSAYAFAQGAVAGVPVDNSNHYTDVLPSLNLRWHLTDDLQLRFATSKAISRPSFAQMVPYTSLGFTFTNNFNPGLIPASGTGGNTKLNPVKSTNYDTSLEWYFAPGGSLTGAVFYKEVKDYIFMGNQLETYTAGGQTINFLVSRNLNGNSGKIKGFEIAYQQFYDMLPGAFGGLGVQANFTHVESNGGKNTAINILEQAQVDGAADQTLPLEGLSKSSYNVALLYEKYGLSARFAYNWRSRYLLTTSAANIQRPVWSEDYGQLDGSVFYSITENIKLGIQGTNLLNSRTFLDVGGVTLAPRYSWTDTDRRLAFIVRASF